MGKEDGHCEAEEATGKAQEDEWHEWKRERAGRDAHEVERWQARCCAHEYETTAKLALPTISLRRQPDPTLDAFAWYQPDPTTRVIHPDLAEHLTGGRRNYERPPEFRRCEKRGRQEIGLCVQQWNHGAAHAEGERPEHNEELIHSA